MWLAQVQTPTVTIPSVTIPGIVIALIIAAAIGLVVQLIIGYSHIGCLGHILVGIVGALLGNLIAFWFKLPFVLIVFGVDVVWTFLGSAVLVLILAAVVGGRRYRGFFRRRGGYYE